MDFEKILKKSLNNISLSRDEAKEILELEDKYINDLLVVTFEVRKKFKQKLVNIHILTNVKSGNCTEDCSYCAQSCVSKATIKNYDMINKQELLEDRKLAKEKNIKRHCLGLSGMSYSEEMINLLVDYLKDLKKENNIDICCSMGFLTREQAIRLKDAGLTRVNHNLNTGRKNYENICSTHTFQERVENIQMLQEVGLEICSGGIIGLGESNDDILDMFFELMEINPHSVPVNFLLPVNGTPLGNKSIEELTPQYCLKVLCLARLLMPKQNIRCAAGREIYFKGFEKELFSIVNSIFAGGYLTEKGEGIERTIELIQSCGFEYEME